jgi:hypothetical protein
VGVQRVKQNALNQTLILHRTASGWRQVSSPNPGGTCSLGCDNELTGVAGRWAVGYYTDSSFTSRALIVHWVNGTWRSVTVPSASSATLNGTSGKWAVGQRSGHTLILRRTGGNWAPA